MARTTESSVITTLAGLEQMERERVEHERLVREAELDEQRQRERRLAVEAEASERRARWAEQDRARAEAREREQHEARLCAMHEALVTTAKFEAEARHARERAEQLHIHERKVAELTNDSRVRSMRRGLFGAGLGIFALATASVGFAYDARAKTSRLEESASRIESLERALTLAEHDRDGARERQSLADARISLLEAKLSKAVAAPVPANEVELPQPRAPLPKVTDRRRFKTPKPCLPDPNGDPLDDCVP
jgi:hypothetical protein